MLGNHGLKKYDVIVVGAGIVGAACAWELSKAGQKVLVLESEGLSSGVTSAGMGHIVAMDDSPAQLALTTNSRERWTRLFSQLPKECEKDSCGTLWVACDEEELSAAEKREKLFAEHGVKAKVIGADDLYKLEPNLRRGLVGGLHVPGDSVVYHPLCVKWLLEGIEIRSKIFVSQISDKAVHTEKETFQADAIVLAGGMGSRRLIPSLPLIPKKGHLVVTDRVPGFCKRQIIELGYLKSAHGSQKESVAFNIQPRKTGQFILGSSREVGVDDKNINRPLLAQMLGKACEYMPSLKDLQVLRTWVGTRPSTQDNLPLIGPWSAIKGLYVATGHEGLGITTSLSTAHLIACSILNQTPEISPTPYSAERVLEKAVA